MKSDLAASGIALSVVYLGVSNLVALRRGRDAHAVHPARHRWLVERTLLA